MAANVEEYISFSSQLVLRKAEWEKNVHPIPLTPPVVSFIGP